MQFHVLVVKNESDVATDGDLHCGGSELTCSDGNLNDNWIHALNSFRCSQYSQNEGEQKEAARRQCPPPGWPLRCRYHSVQG